MSKFQQRHYEAIAELVYKLPKRTITKRKLAIALADYFKSDNIKFYPHLFFAACGEMELWLAAKPAKKVRIRQVKSEHCRRQFAERS